MESQTFYSANATSARDEGQGYDMIVSEVRGRNMIVYGLNGDEVTFH